MADAFELSADSELIMKFLFFFKLVILSIVSRYCTSLLIESKSEINWGHVEKILRPLLKHQDSVTVFKVIPDNSLKLFNNHGSALQMIQSLVPVKIFDSIDEIIVNKFHDMGDEYNSPSTIKSYFVLSTATEVLDQHLKFFSKINTNGKWIFVLIDVNPRLIESLLMEAWNVHKMTNILALFSDKHSKTFIKFYNPFKRSGSEFGSFWTSELNNETISMADEIKNMFERKVANLQNYPLKASIYPNKFQHNQILDDTMKEVFEKALNAQLMLVHIPLGNSKGVGGTFSRKL